MKKKSVVLLSMVICGGCFAGTAVSGMNGKVGVSTGSMDSDTGKNVMGSFSAPLGTNFGFQVDALYTDVAERDFYGLGAHLFWRDSDKGLLGITAGGVRENDVLDSWAVGTEGEYYLDKITVGAQAGVANIDYKGGSAPFISTDETDFYATAEVGFYPVDNVLVSLTYTRAFNNNLTQGQIEYQTPINGVSLFADVAQGDNDYDHALVGLRYYFGSDKSLKLRHRQDDPPNVLNAVLYNIGTYGSEFNRNAEKYVETHNGGAGAGGGDYGAVISVIGGPPYPDDDFSTIEP